MNGQKFAAIGRICKDATLSTTQNNTPVFQGRVVLEHLGGSALTSAPLDVIACGPTAEALYARAGRGETLQIEGAFHTTTTGTGDQSRSVVRVYITRTAPAPADWRGRISVPSGTHRTEGVITALSGLQYDEPGEQGEAFTEFTLRSDTPGHAVGMAGTARLTSVIATGTLAVLAAQLNAGQHVTVHGRPFRDGWDQNDQQHLLAVQIDVPPT